MAHDLIKHHSVHSETGRASALIVGILLGGTLVLASYAAKVLFTEPVYSDLLALVGAILLGAPILLHAGEELLHGHTSLDAIVALAVIAAVAALDYQAAGTVAFFLLLANLIETRTALGARASIEGLLRISPKKAHRLAADGTEELVDPLALAPGDVVRIRPGDNIPADGVVLRGESSVNQATVTGESIPVDKAADDEVFSGTNNLSGVIDVKVTRAGDDTTLGRVKKLILQAEGSKIPIMRLIDRYAGWYTPTILMIAGAMLFFTRDMSKTVTLLVVSCPCALVLAVPTAMVAALSCAARLGILIKDVSTLETAKDLSAFVFDKTGTLTTGELSVTQVRPGPGAADAAEAAGELLAAAASVEQMSKHPVARAVVRVAREAKVALSAPTDFLEHSGRGVQARVDGKTVLVGRGSWITEQGVSLEPMKAAPYAEPEGVSTLYVAADGRLLGWIGLEDRTREEARAALDELRALGIRELVMVTGDRWSVAHRVAREMGATEVQAEVLPADKLELVDALKRQGYKVAVVGDGVNDAPALAAGDLSIAMSAAGSDVAINSAAIALMNNDLRRLPLLVKLSRRTIQVIYQNLLGGAAFITAFAILAGLGYIKPVMGAVLPMLAATAVIFNSARLVRFGEELHAPAEAAEASGTSKMEPVAAG